MSAAILSAVAVSSSGGCRTCAAVHGPGPFGPERSPGSSMQRFPRRVTVAFQSKHLKCPEHRLAHKSRHARGVLKTYGDEQTGADWQIPQATAVRSRLAVDESADYTTRILGFGRRTRCLYWYFSRLLVQAHPIRGSRALSSEHRDREPGGHVPRVMEVADAADAGVRPVEQHNISHYACCVRRVAD